MRYQDIDRYMEMENRSHDITVKQILEKCDPKHEWYDDSKLWETGKHWLIGTSVRGYGKSTRIACRLLAEYIVNGKKWLYLRRTDRLLNATKHSFFDKARQIINRAGCGFQITWLECDTGIYKIMIEWDDEEGVPEEIEEAGDDEIAKWRKKNAKQCGLAMALSTGEEEAKSGGGKFDGVKFGVFDEFMAARETGYLGSIDDPDVEYEALYSIYMSISRDMDNPFLNDVYFIMLGNRSHDYNPILLNLGVNEYMAQSPDAHIIAPKAEEWAIEFIEPTEGFKKKQRESVQYKLAQHSRKELEFNFENTSKDMKVGDTFIMRDKPGAVRFYNNVILNNKEYGVYYRDRDGLVYIGHAQQGKGYRTEALDIASYYNGNAVMLVRRWRDSPVLNLIYERFIYKMVMFCDKETQRQFMMYLDFIPKR